MYYQEHECTNRTGGNVWGLNICVDSLIRGLEKVRKGGTRQVKKYIIYLVLFAMIAFNHVVYADSPLLLTPPNGSTITSLPVTFSWQAVEGATQYQFQIAKDAVFTDIELNKTLPGTSDEISFVGDGNPRYWRVKAQNISGWGDWSETRSFNTIAPPDSPVLLSPSNGSTITSLPVTFSWQAVDGAVQYQFQMAKDTAFDNIERSKLLTTTSLELSFAGDGNPRYWRVRAKNVSGWGDWSDIWGFHTIAPPGSPVLLSPPNGSTITSLPVTFSWQAVDGATQYQFQMAKDTAFDNIERSKLLTTTTLELSFVGDGNPRYWRIRAQNVSGWGDWSAAWSFMTIAPPQAPVLSAPSDGSTIATVPVTFVWQAVGDAIQYQFQIAKDATFTNIEASRLLTTTSFDLSFAGDGNPRYWRVRVKNVSGWGDWSDIWTFHTIAPPEGPVLLTPPDGSTITSLPVTFSWQAVDGAIQYQFQMAKDAVFTNIECSKLLTTISLDLSFAGDGNPRYWRVRAKNVSGWGDWSDIWTFHTIAPPEGPVLLTPPDGSTITSLPVTFSWQAVDGAIQYQFQMAKDAVFTNIECSKLLTTISLDLSFAGDGNPRYWRVRAKNVSGWGDWSDIWTFHTIAPPESPVLLSPSNGTTITSLPLTFSWQAVDGAIQYQFQMAKDTTFDNIERSKLLTTTSLQLTFAGDGNPRYWRIRAQNISGWGDWSDIWSFHTIAPPESPVLLTPPDGTTITSLPVTFSWQAVEGAIDYHLEIAKDLAFTDKDVTRFVADTSVEIYLLGDGNPRYWRVRAQNVCSWGDWSEMWGLNTIAPPEYPRFGTHSHPCPESMTEVGAEWLSFCPQIFWGNAENPTSQPGVYRFKGYSIFDTDFNYDGDFTRSKSMGIKNGFTLRCFGPGTPRSWTKWQEDKTQLPIDDYPGTLEDGSVDPDLKQAWVDFVKKAVERYNGDSNFGCTVDPPDCYCEGDNQYPDFALPNPPKADFYHIEETWCDVWWHDEPDKTPDNPIPAIRYVNFLKITSQAIKEVDPEARIILTGLSSGHLRHIGFADGYIDDQDGGLREGIYYTRDEIINSSWYQLGKSEIEYILREGKDYFDIVDVHLYEEKTSFLEGKIRWLRDKMQDYGYQKPIWSIEAGGPYKLSQEEIDCILDPLCEGPRDGDYSFGPYTDKENAEFVLKLFSLAFGSQMDRFTFSATDSEKLYFDGAFNHMGLLSGDIDPIKKPSFYTYKLMTSKLRYFDSVEKLDYGVENYIFKFDLEGGSHVFVMWSDKEDGDVIDLSAHVSTGNVKIIHIVTELDVNNSPIYLPDEIVPASWIPVYGTPGFAEEVD